MIPIAKPSLGEEEVLAVRETILSGWVSQGPKVKQFEDDFASFVGAKYACAVSSCTTALHLSLLGVGVKPGDVVITVSHSFIATANAVRYCSAEPVFIDITPDTFNISPALLEKFLNEECEESEGTLYYRDAIKLAKAESPLSYLKGTKKRLGRLGAIMPVHQMGMPCDIEKILAIAKRFNLPVIEDAACAIGSAIEIGGERNRIGRPHGDTACFSFHPRKVITTGDGGMITTNDAELDKKFRLLRQHGMSVPDTVRHGSKEIIFEEYVTTAFNYRMTDMQAAMGIVQLKKLPEIVESRRKVNTLYREHLKDIEWLRLPTVPEYARTNFQSYPVRVLDTSPGSRNELMQYLLDRGISTRVGIMNIHREKPYTNSVVSLPVSEAARDEVILFPVFEALNIEDIKEIASAVRDFPSN